MDKVNIFDKVMNIIDENIRKNFTEIKEEIYAVSGYSEMQFTKAISIFSNGVDTLRTYFKKRKAYFAAKELVDYPEKPIAEIALEYGYADQPKFTNEMKRYYKHTPKDIRTNQIRLEDNRFRLSNFKAPSETIGKRLQDAIDGMINENTFSEDDYSRIIHETSERCEKL
ncbi:AraC family transcriptional regulator [Ruminococcus sp. HUN007]|uniref:helix-turn-helix domain-containing protein n=1 Tax=Ruminococcus sp. HUN007 TaxID=1514668 RepID=UPI0005D15D0A|nr:AraC family transcriptional regulator [Ruminococcus sp. HUN007]